MEQGEINGRSSMPNGVEPSDEVLGASAMRAQHSKLILNLLWREREISRADLARRTGLSRSTVSAIVNDLLETGLVHEARPGVSTGGRKPVILEFVDDAHHLIGVELGASHVSVALVNLRGNVVAWKKSPCAVRDDPERALALLEAGVAWVLRDASVLLERIIGIGIAAPSPMDPNRPGELMPLVIPKWAGINPLPRLRRAFGVPVLIDNDANLGALAEQWWGAGRGGANLAFIKIATGIGAGLILNGRIYRGSRGVAGEIGHMSVDPNGPRCICGLNGCLGMLIGTQPLVTRFRGHPRASARTTEETRNATSFGIDSLVDLALADDFAAQEVIAFAGRTLGIGVANMLNLLNPEIIVLGGGITRAGNLLLEPLREAVNGMSLAEAVAHAEILLTGFKHEGIALGAATLVLEAALADPSLFLRSRTIMESHAAT